MKEKEVSSRLTPAGGRVARRPDLTGQRRINVVMATEEVMEERKSRRVHFDHPSVKVNSQSEGFDRLLALLYQLEDGPVPGDRKASRAWVRSRTFAEARAVCELFLPPFRASQLRRLHDRAPDDEE